MIKHRLQDNKLLAIRDNRGDVLLDSALNGMGHSSNE